MTGEVAQLLGVHRSTVKRWCDAGELPCSVTEGGHRRIALSALLAFAGARDLSCPLLAFRSQEAAVWQVVSRAEEQHDYEGLIELGYQWLAEGKRAQVHSLFRFVHGREWPLPVLFDRLVRSVMDRVGEAWRAGTIHVGDEHRMSHVMFDSLHEMRASIRADAPEQMQSSPLAVVGCGANNRHEMGTLMVRMVLEAAGWQTLYLGADVPTRDFALQQDRYEAGLLCISLAPPQQIASDAERILDSLASLYDEQHPYRIALGGQAVQNATLSAGYPFAAYRAFPGLQTFAQWIRSFSPQAKTA